MAMSAHAHGFAYEANQRIACGDRTRIGARMTRAAGTVDLARSYASQADPWPFFAPDRPVTIPHGNRRACEGFTCGDSCQKKE